ncbi:MAG: hypothetical protein JW892_13490, partial [Anaerolineae bacterium]|nr:hypothetical protein [Anaerolineae bacterium]
FLRAAPAKITLAESGAEGFLSDLADFATVVFFCDFCGRGFASPQKSHLQKKGAESGSLMRAVYKMAILFSPIICRIPFVRV